MNGLQPSIRRCFAVARKEFRSSFHSPVAYIVIVLFLSVTSGWLFLVENFFARNLADLRSYFGVMPVVLAIMAPALTMRLWAEEYRLGTYELLTSLPLRETELVIGKFLGAAAVLGVAVLLTFSVPLSLSRLGSFDRGQIVGEYLGLILLGSAAVAVGSLVSSLTRNQVSAFLLSVGVLLGLVLAGYAAAWLEVPHAARRILQYLSLQTRFHSLVKGVVDTRDVGYFGVMIATALYFNVQVLIVRKWR